MPDVEDLFRASSKAYDERDIKKALSFVSDDYAWFKITEDGAELRSKGKEQAAFGLKMVFDSEEYIKGDVTFLKSFGNIVVAYEKDQYKEGGEFVTRGTLGVYIYQGDKLSRVYSFSVDGDD